MGEIFDTDRDMGADNRSDIRSSVSNESSADYGGDLAKDTGVDLNTGADVSDSGTVEKAHDSPGENLNDTGADAVLDNFLEDKWSDKLEERKQSITDLASYVAADTGNKNPPEIDFRDDMPDNTYGGYNPETNTVEINENKLNDPTEAADTIAHEMFHAYQWQAAKDPNNPRAQEYQEGIDNYISDEYNFEGYENQMVEAESRDYAQGFKDRLAGMKGAA